METQTTTVPISTLRPGDVVMINGKPEVVYHTRSNRAGTIQTHAGERAVPGQVELVPSSDAAQALRREDPEVLYKHFTLPFDQKIGADPEVFMVDARGDVLPAFVYLPKKENVASQEVVSFYDGFQAEFTIPAISCLGFTTDYVRTGLQQVRAAARAKDPNAQLVVDGVLPIPYNMRRAVDPVHLQLGCAPSKNAYGESPIAVPSPEDLDIRFAGSHMHFGMNPYSIKLDFTTEVVERAVKMLDAVLGVAGVSFGEGIQHPARRRYYGRAGEYRYKDQRIEYRVPDVHLIAHPATMNLLWELGRVVVKMGLLGMGFLWDASEEEVRGIINEYDVPKAREVLVRNENMLRAILRKSGAAQESCWGNAAEWTEEGVKVLLHGIGSVVRNPRDLDGNWWLDAATTTKTVGDDNLAGLDIETWWTESYARKHDNWPTGRIWSSAAKIIQAGGMV